MSYRLKRCHVVSLVLYLIVLFTTIFLVRQYGNQIDVAAIKSWVASFGPLAPIVFLLLSATTNVIPPMPVIPFWLAGLMLFNPPLSYVLIYLSNITGASVGYLIARYLGRPAVAKVAGQQALVKIDQYVGLRSFWAITLLRFCSGVASDYLSYAYGLTKIRFIPYLLSSAIGLLPSAIIGIYFINQSLTRPLAEAPAYLGIITLSNYLTTLITIPVFISLRRREMKKENPT